MPPELRFWLDYPISEPDYGLLLYALRQVGPEGVRLADAMKAHCRPIISHFTSEPVAISEEWLACLATWQEVEGQPV